MPPHQTPSADAHPDPAPKRPRPAQPVAHLMRQHVARSGQRPEEIDWAAFAGQTGLPLSEVLSIASFHEEFSGSARAMPPEFGPEAPCLATDARLTAKEDPTDLLRFVEALRRSATPAESIWNRLRHLEGWNEHRSKSRRTIWDRWQDAVTTPAPRRFLICHAEAGNPGADGSRWLLRHRPTKVLSGIALAATAVGATDCVICVDRSRPELLQDL
ncbi:MAG: hypothetical protein KDM64_01755, partial [Verrucomicrobiae bacterium]|nr:hypothetical protein [Verrucomicrobiae bacterium]